MIDYAKIHADYWANPEKGTILQPGDTHVIAAKLLDLCGPGSVLDVGSGMGWLVQALLAEGIDARGVDVVERIVHLCNARVPNRFTVGSILELPFKDAAFETVASIDCLQHISPNDIPRAIREMIRVCQQNILLKTSTVADSSGPPALTIRDRNWWEQQFLAGAARKHPNYGRLTPQSENESQPMIVLEKLPTGSPPPDPLDALRQTGPASGAAISQYQTAAKYIRPGDTVVDLNAGAGFGLHVLRHNSPASNFLGFCSTPQKTAYADALYRDGTKLVEFRTADPSAALPALADHSVDHVLAFGVLNDRALDPTAFLREIRRVLIPGGRLILSISSQKSSRSQLRDLLSLSLLFELMDEAHANLPPPSLIATAIRDPLEVDALAIPYRETVFPNLHSVAHVSTEYARFYRNPWIVHSMVHVGYRVKSASLLEKLAHRLLSGSPPDTADYGAALCILAYRLLDDPAVSASDDIAPIASRISPYLAIKTDNPHIHRWQISLTFALANLQLRAGDLAPARDSFRACAQMDPFLFSVHLATKTTESFFWAGWLAITAGDPADARHWWSAGVDFGNRLISRPIDDVLVNTADPNIYDHGDGMREFVLAIENITQCTNGLHLLSRQAQGRSVNWQDVHKTFRSRGDGFLDQLREAQSKVATLNSQILVARRDLDHRTQELDIARNELVYRTAELDRDRRELVQRTAELDASRGDLVRRTSELDATRAELVGRTRELDKVRRDLIDRTAELDEARRELAHRSSSLTNKK